MIIAGTEVPGREPRAFRYAAIPSPFATGVSAMEMHQIRYFLALCDELNFTRAAEVSNVSQPSLTRAIKMLEEELGGPLFHRERANTHLSELGRTVKPYLEQVYREADKAKRQAQDFVRLERTPLRLGLMCTIAPNQMLEFIAAVQLRHPGIALQIVDAAATELEQRLVAGELEAAIYADAARPSIGGRSLRGSERAAWRALPVARQLRIRHGGGSRVRAAEGGLAYRL
jgi:DNA-binding transcriptional LysR family regulator